MDETNLTPESIRGIAYCFQSSRTLLTAYELGIFSVLGNNSQSSRQVAHTLGTAWRSTDRLMNEQRKEPGAGAFFALNMLMGTAVGDTYTESEIRGWMNEAGLTATSRVETPFGTAQIWGRRPD